MDEIKEYQHRIDETTYFVTSGEEGIEAFDDLRSEIASSLSDLQWDLDKLHEEMSDAEETIEEAKCDPMVNAQDASEALQDMEVRENELDETIDSYKSLLQDIDSFLNLYAVFDKRNCFQNIRRLLKEKNIKVGQLENNAGVATGYMSRLEKTDNTTDPSIQFVAMAAKMLGVTIDELLYYKETDLSEAEKYVLSFLNNVKTDTLKGNLAWTRLKSDILGMEHNTEEEPDISHPLLRISKEPDFLDMIHTYLKYKSDFFPTAKVMAGEHVYYTELNSSEDQMYIVECFTEDSDKVLPGKRFYEIYLIDGQKEVNPLCNTLQAPAPIVATINELIKAAMASSERVNVGKESKAIIERYMDSRKQQLPF